MIKFFFLVIVYFVIRKNVPWYKMPIDLPFAYIFDVLYVICVSYFSRHPWGFRWKLDKESVAYSAEVVTLASASILIVWNWSLFIPYRLSPGLEWHSLLFAPLLEELIYRQAFQGYLIQKFGTKRITSLIVAFLFSASHLFHLQLPERFHLFVGLQVFYTFFLGYICGQAYLHSRSVLAPIFLHFLFNLTYYIALRLGVF